MREKYGKREDGEYRLMVAGRNVSIYCFGMAGTQAPLEFLTLPVDRADVSSNFAEIDEKR